MTFLVFLAGGVLGFGLAWLIYLDDMGERGKHVVPEDIEYRCYWVHNGWRYYAEQKDDEYLEPLRLPPHPERKESA